MSSDKSESECDLHDDISDDESLEKVVQPKKKAKTTVGDVKKATTATVVKEKAPRAKASKPPAVKKDTGQIKVSKPSNSKSKAAVENSNALTTVSNNITTTGPTIDINNSSSSSSYQSHANNPQQQLTLLHLLLFIAVTTTTTKADKLAHIANQNASLNCEVSITLCYIFFNY
jgi:hypothetical protein